LKIPGGYIVAIEGIDAAGKNTQSLLLRRELTRRGIKASGLSFPDYNTPIGRQIRSFLSGADRYPVQLQHLLFAANRWEKCYELTSRLKSGEAIIVNRYTDSNIAYGAANGLDVEWLANLEKGLPKPDLVILLDAPIISLNPRRPEASKDTYEKSTRLQAKAQKIYRELAHSEDWKLIDASRSIGDVQAAVLAAVRESLLRHRGTRI
jgi:dTMP kinase